MSPELEDDALDETGGLVCVTCAGPVELPNDEDVTLGAVLDLAPAVDEAGDEDEEVAGVVADDPLEAADPVAGLLEVAGFGVDVVHLGVGAGLAAVAELELLLALGLGLELGLTVLLGLGLTVPLVPGLGLEVGLELEVGVSLGLAVVVLWLLLDDTAGELATVVCAGVVALPDEPDAEGVADELGEADTQPLTTGLPMPAMRPGVPAPVGIDVPLWSVVDAELPVDGEVPVMAELSVEPICPTSARAAGTEARTTPTVKTVRPVAKAGRSMAPRQSRLGAGRSGSGCSGLGRRPRKPRMAGQMALTPCWLAWAERDRTFSRIRSRPSAPGST